MQKKKITNIEQLAESLFDVAEKQANGEIDSEEAISRAKVADSIVRALNAQAQRQGTLGIKAPIKGLDDAYIDSNKKIDRQSLFTIQNTLESKASGKNKSLLVDEFIQPKREGVTS